MAPTRPSIPVREESRREGADSLPAVAVTVEKEGRAVLSTTPLPAPSGSPSPSPTAPPSVGGAASLVVDQLRHMGNTLLRNLPLIGVGIVLLVLGLVLASYLGKLASRGLQRTGADHVVISLSSRLIRLVTIIAVILLALSVAGVNVRAALAGLGIAGLAVAFALQNILENFVAGVLLLIRKPFRSGDQIRTGDIEGTVDEIDLRVTRLVDYDGELILVPNADVFTKTLVNLTRRGKRRSRVAIGIDYRDDHERAREILREVVTDVEGVLAVPAPEVLLVELGESSVNFELRYWTLPDISSVLRTKDRVLSAAKTAVEAAGMTIPWPIRTLSFDNAIPRAPETDGRDGRGHQP